jgi:cell division septum initiation protein DivIVA
MSDSHTSDPAGLRVPRDASASERLREVSFPLAVRGYERAAVDEFVNGVRALVAELEAGQTRDGAVHKALDEVGVETASILQRAHDTANQLTSRAQAEADAGLRQADSEAEQVRREADEYSERVVIDTRLLWEERQRLIEDIRQLADEVLATGDHAMERLKLPEPLAVAEAEPTTEEEEATGPVGVPDDLPPPGAVEDEDETEPYEAGAFGDESLDAETAPYRINAVEEERPPEEDEPDHTVELEALPGGGEAQPAGEEQADQPGTERGWDRERD